MNTQSDLLTKTVKDINIYNENLKILLQNSSIKNESINTNVYGYDSILEESFNVSEKIKFFSDNFAKRDQQRYDYEIATLILLPIFTVSGIIGK